MISQERTSMLDNKITIRGGYRKDWIDALRAIAMILVVYGHQVSDWTEYFVFTSPIKICLFFAISGYVFNTSRESKDFLFKLLRQLVIPWLVLSCIQPVLLSPMNGGLSYIKSGIVEVLIGNSKWYMPCCIVAEIVWYGVNNAAKNKIVLVAIISYALFTVGILLYQHNLLNFWMINRALTVQPYLLIGAAYRKYGGKIREKSKVIVILGVVIYLGLGVSTVIAYPGQCIDVHMVQYYNHIICQLMIWIGIIVLFLLFEKLITTYPKWLVKIGKNTLVIYLFHSLAIVIVCKFLSALDVQVGRVLNVLITAFVCDTCCLFSIGIGKVAPWLIGRSRKT